MNAGNNGRGSALRTAIAATLAYLVYSALYIWFSDRIIFALLGGDPAALLRLSTIKGLAFVAVTSVALFLLVWRLESAASRAARAEAERRFREGETARDLAEANERLRLLVEGAPHFFFYVQELDGALSYVSPSVERITGRPISEWLAHSHWFTTDNPVNEEARRATAAHLRGEFDGRPVTVESRHANGHLVLLEVHEYGRYRGGELVGLQGLAHDVTERRRAERLQGAILRISQAANSVRTLRELFVEIHAVVAGLMSADNLYIALHDPESGLLTFPHFVDQFDPPPPPRKTARGLTEYVLRTGEPLLASPDVAEALERRGEVELIGAPSIDWLGVPLKIRDRTIGVLAVQSYTEGLRFGEVEKSILMFVSTQVAMGIERTRAEEALRSSEQKLRDIVEHSTNLFYAHTADQVLTFVSPQSRAFLDCEPEEALGRWTEFATDNPVNAAGFEATERAIRTGQRQPPYELELEGRRGRRIWVEVNEAPVVRDGRTVAVVGALTDITARKQAQQQLAESEERHRRLVELSPDGIAIHSGGTIVFCNTTGARMLGYASVEEVLGRPMLQFVHPEYREVVGRRVREALASGRPQPSIEEKFLRADGSAIDVEVASSPFVYQGKPAVYVVLRDITPRRQLEEQLRHVQKMEAIGRLAGGVAHDFNNLLQVLLSTTEGLQARQFEPEKLAATVGEIEAHVRRGAALTRQLLLFARRETLKLESVDLNAVVGGTAALLRRLVPENIRLRLELADDALALDADRGQLEQVLVNLVVNAGDAMPDGGEVAISTGRTADAEAFLEVRDRGVGIPDEMLATIFEPFFTTKEAERGTGLGLAVVHGIVTSHGGRMEVTSRVGEGSCFRVVLPLRPPGSPVTGHEAGPRRPIPSGGGERVLVVEDEPGARAGIREILELLHYEVTAVGSGEEAEALPAAPTFAVLLTDLLLPGVHGGELAARLARRWPDLRVVVMSGYAEDEAVRRGVREGSVRFLMKPFDMETLAREMRAALEEPR